MATSKSAKVEFELGQQAIAFTAMTDGGDHMVHSLASALVYSGQGGYEPNIRPNGIVTGRNLLSTNATVEVVTVGAFTAYSKGVLRTVSATTATVVRASTDVSKICSVCMDEDGVIEVVEGTDGTDATFSETRGAAGGPPSIPADSVELGQVRMTSNVSAVIDSDEIFQVVGNHTERFDYPVWNENNTGDGDDAETPAQKNAYIKFSSALSLVHGSTPGSAATAYKKVYAKVYTPIYAEQSRAFDFVPAETSHSVSSQQVYNDTVGSVSSSLGQSSFSALMTDNVTDALLQQKNKVVTVRHYPDRNKSAYTLTQGTLGVSRTFPAGSENQVACTLSCSKATVSFSS